MTKSSSRVMQTAAAAVVFCASVANGADVYYYWQGDTANNTPTNAYSWTAAGNWKDAGGATVAAPVNAANARCVFSNGTSGRTKFISIPDNTLLGRIDAGTDFTVYLARNITVSTLSYAGNWIDPGQTMFADRISGATFGGGCNNVAALMDFTDGQWTFSAGSNRYRMDYFATSSDPERRNEIPNFKKVIQGSGTGYWYAPRGAAAAQTIAWAQTAGSPYLKRVSDTSTALPVGTLVTGTGIPAGTFLKRTMPSGWIELSAPVTVTSDSNDVTFAAFTPNVYQHLDYYYGNGGANGAFSLTKYRAEDTAVMEIDSFYVEGKVCGFDSSSYPWHVILHKVTRGGSGRALMMLGTCDLEFAETVYSHGPGIPDQLTYVKDVNAKAALTVNAGLTASILMLSNVVGQVTKKGAGTLKTTLAVKGAAHTGSITVSGGAFEFVGAADVAGEQKIATLTLAAGTTCRVAAGAVLHVSTLAMAGATLELGAGAVLYLGDVTYDADSHITGSGKVVFSSASKYDAALPVGSGVTIGILGGREGVVAADPVAGVVGTPAFWVDASAADSLVTETIDDVTYVSRWNDCRGTEAQGYNFATNVYARPKLAKLAYTTYANADAASLKITTNLVHVAIPVDSAKTQADCAGLVWGRGLSGIRSVFLVMDIQGGGGGCILGSTKFAANVGADFARGNVTGAQLFYLAEGFASPSVYNAPIYINGVPTDRTNTLPTGTYKIPFLFEVHPTDAGGHADAFGMQGTRWDLAGGQRIFECLIYTNELTRAEQASVADYLTRKWFSTPYNARTAADADTLAAFGGSTAKALDIESGAVTFEALSGAGALTKTGAGELYIREATDGGDLTVGGGTVTVRSAAEPTLATLPGGASLLLHLDAVDLLDAGTASEIVTLGKGQCVKTWRNVRGTSSLYAKAANTNCPLVKAITPALSSRVVEGRAAVDMGPFHKQAGSDGYGTWITKGNAENLFLSATRTDIRSAFFVVKGGNVLLGMNATGNNYQGGGIQRGPNGGGNGLASDPITGSGSHPISLSTGYPYYGHVFRDGVRVDGATTGLTGDYDVVGLTTFLDPIRASAFACIHYNNQVGGQELGEVILYNRALTDRESAQINAYLKKKWYGETTAGFKTASLGAVTVAEGATLTVSGGAPLAATGLGGAGTVAGDVSLAANAVIELPVEADGTITQALTVSGALDLSKGGTVVLTGDHVRELKTGRYLVCTAGSLTCAAQDWRATDPAGRKALRLVKDGNALYLNVTSRGLLIYVTAE